MKKTRTTIGNAHSEKSEKKHLRSYIQQTRKVIY